MSVPATRPGARHHDIVIVGGGLVGASLAIALDGLGLDVAMVEAAAAGALPAVFDQRNLSFADATCNALANLGVWRLLRTPPGPIRRIHVSRRGDFGRVELDARDYGREAFGQVVVASDFGEALEARLAELRNLTRYRPARFIDTHVGGDARTLRISDGDGEHQLSTRLLVGADGTESMVRKALGIAAQRQDYGKVLFVARMRCGRAPDGSAYERLGDDGPTALLPRGDRHYGVVHAVPANDADAVAALDDAAWCARIQDAFGWRAGRFLSADSRSRYPAQQVLADGLIAPRGVVVGNAAQTIHPIGAQGFNLGLRDALTLVECIAASLVDAGSDAMLQRYAQRREEDRSRTIAFSDGLARIGMNPSPLLRPLRSLGMAAIAEIDAVQSLLVGGAMGYRGDVPALCREVVR
ncbi:2-octaprenyl-6-methoxyphenyl hydroxylase [Solilutibacter silvestris]|uniref:UbiH: 2-polyprenyl-6-methoxyphenol 4-hydroxylase n=1 Tax=Solilutibacter silvestris TaxID=1645665 RepID=A0A2K1PXK0_9GAMM|nr:2-octaprenyl-6-methoxyphenyl hydroxylase [Lysobacter silvestris]PNS07514.1 UbiH: 2-polyprenyl-6-methoxyphenol 4-hydroxylase [Lysobacter silvestris]